MKPDLRYEIKLVCDQYRLAQARHWIRLHPAGFVVAYPPRRVNSLYLDTRHLSSLQDNLQGSDVRQKLRLRWYGDEMMHIQPYLELKQKRNLLGAKTRCLLPCKLDMTAHWSDILKTICANVTPSWQALLQTVDQPTLLNHYRREYFVTPDGAVRITLDWAQTAYDQRLSPRPNFCFPLPITDSVVVEVKAGQDQAERVEEIVAQFPIRRSRNSKYVGSLLAALG